MFLFTRSHVTGCWKCIENTFRNRVFFFLLFLSRQFLFSFDKKAGVMQKMEEEGRKSDTLTHLSLTRADILPVSVASDALYFYYFSPITTMITSMS